MKYKSMSELKLIFFFCPIPRLEILIPAGAKHCKHAILPARLIVYAHVLKVPSALGDEFSIEQTMCESCAADIYDVYSGDTNELCTDHDARHGSGAAILTGMCSKKSNNSSQLDTSLSPLLLLLVT